MAVEQDLALQMQEFQRIEADTGKGLLVEALRIGPFLVPVRAHEDDRAFGDAAVLFLPFLDIGNLQMIALVLGDLAADVDHHQGTDGIGGRQVADRGAERVPVRRRIELGSVLVGRQLIGRGDEAMLVIGELLARLHIAFDVLAGDGRLELGIGEAGPYRLHRLEGMGEVDIFRRLQAVFVELPERILLRKHRGGCDKGYAERGEARQASCFHFSHSRRSVATGNDRSKRDERQAR